MSSETLFEQIKHVIEKSPDARALTFENKFFSYRDLENNIMLTAGRLKALGVKKRDVVTVMLPNCPDSVFVFYAVSILGAIAYNIHPLSPAASIPKMAERVKSKYIICLLNNAAENREALSEDVKVIAINPFVKTNLFKAIAFNLMSKNSKGVTKLWKVKAEKIESIYKIEKDREDAVYMNTGGTTGEMKVVRLSNESINWIAFNSKDILLDKVPKAKMLAALPFFHVFGLGMGLHTPLSIGGSACLVMRFNTKEVISQMRKGNITIVLGVPGIFNALLSKERFYGPHLKDQIAAYLGGDAASEILIRNWNEAMKKYGSSCRLYVGYGLTETSTACNVNTLGGRNKNGSIGRPIIGVKNKIIDLETGKECPPNTFGEILIGGPSLMNGYYGDDKLTSETLFCDENGEKWLHTKDYGYIDEDGYLFFKQRTKRIVKINGETLCPADVEDVVNSLSGIYESYCYGIESERKGQLFKLLVVIRRNKKPWSTEEAKAKIEEAIRSSLPPVYCPSEIKFVDRLPHTAIGKIDTVKAEQL